MTLVQYDGPSDKSDLSTEFHVRDEKGKMHRLYKDRPVAQGGHGDVPDELAKRLLGKDAPAGHKFSTVAKADADKTPPGAGA